ncbi:c-type cytochrome [Pseudomonas sp. BN102]|uniref:c-type cytochrome n=1 Tax=Pseudomonas sp. BN102 TaxID=2567886 RepID=UPI00245699A7|nr:c-type cytochrome [Pseudomonas sp. BN102]MDH4608848.1 c-type cytochrome [Pseudomonas sp. BN102]
MFKRNTGPLFAVLALMATQSVLAADCVPEQVQKGAALFGSDCSVCHSAKTGGPTMMGPNLHGLYGRKSGSLAGFSYSQAMKDKAVEWQLDSLEQFIAQPQAFVTGTYMPYAGMAGADDRRAVGCFLGAQK